MKRSRNPVGGPWNSWALGACTALLASCGPARESQPPSAVLISIDSLRPDRLGCYGHRPEFAPEQHQSPNIDGLAAGGVLFSSAWSSSSWTLPAHMSLLTGLSTAGHAVESDHLRLDPQRQTLAEHLAAAGYATGGFFSGPYLEPRYGFDRGFDVYESAMPDAAGVQRTLEQEQARRAQSGARPLNDREQRVLKSRIANRAVTSPAVLAGADRFLDEHPGEPLFLFLHFFDVHYDYLPDAAVPGLAQRFDPEYQGPFDGVDWFFDERVRDLVPPFERRIGDRDLRHVMALYDAEIQWVDHHVGQLLAKLDALGRADNTVLALVSDHGDEFFEHGGIGHRNTLLREVTQIPLILALPHGAHAGQRIDAPVRIYDLPASLLDFLGAPPLAESEGTSLRPLIEGQESTLRGVLSRLYDPTPWFLNLREGWRNDRYTVVRHFLSSGESLQQTRDESSGERIFHVFDRRTDPAEQHALKPSDPRYQAAVAGFRKAIAEQSKFLATLRKSPASTVLLSEQDSIRRARLEALGYVQHSERPEHLPAWLVLPPP